MILVLGQIKLLWFSSRWLCPDYETSVCDDHSARGETWHWNLSDDFIYCKLNCIKIPKKLLQWWWNVSISCSQSLLEDWMITQIKLFNKIKMFEADHKFINLNKIVCCLADRAMLSGLSQMISFLNRTLALIHTSQSASWELQQSVTTAIMVQRTPSEKSTQNTRLLYSFKRIFKFGFRYLILFSLTVEQSVVVMNKECLFVVKCLQRLSCCCWNIHNNSTGCLTIKWNNTE